jgi:hypothetical protein
LNPALGVPDEHRELAGRLVVAALERECLALSIEDPHHTCSAQKEVSMTARTRGAWDVCVSAEPISA